MAQVVASPCAYAQTDLERAQNLDRCLSGKYPSACIHEWLTPEEKKNVEAAERQENLNTCLTGRFNALCKKNLLTDSELKEVLAAERAENLEPARQAATPLSVTDPNLRLNSS